MESFLAAARAVAGQSSAADVSASTSSGLAWVGRAGVGALAVLLISALALRRSFHLRSKPPAADEIDAPAPVDDETPEVVIESLGRSARDGFGAIAGRVGARAPRSGPRGDNDARRAKMGGNRSASCSASLSTASRPRSFSGRPPAISSGCKDRTRATRSFAGGFGELPTATSCCALLTLHKLAEEAETEEPSKAALADEAVALGAMLEGLAPVALEEGLATYFGDRPADFEAGAPKPRLAQSSDTGGPVRHRRLDRRWPHNAFAG